MNHLRSSGSPANSVFGTAEKQTKIQHLQRINRLTGTISSLISKTVTTALTVIMAYVLNKFYTTKDMTAPQAHRSSPWSQNTQLWPALVLAISSLLSLLIDVGESIASCYSSRSIRAEQIESRFTTAGRVLWVVKWVVVAVLYRIGKTTKDLWGWSCDERAGRIQEFYPELRFRELCVVQSTAWYLSISMAVLNIVWILDDFEG